jgi:branched-chain amino acid transport system permease protein
MSGLRRVLGGADGRAVWWRENRPWAGPATVALLAASAAALPWGFDDHWRSVFVEALQFSLLALGLNVVVGFAGLLDLGYIAFFAIGNYAFAIPTAREYSKALFLEGGRDLPPTPYWEPWMWLLLAVAVAAAMISGIVLGAPTLRLRGDYLAIVTLGFGEIVRIIARNLDSITVGSRGITNIPHPELPGYHFGLDPIGYYYALLLVVIAMVWVISRLNDSRVGRAWHAIREDEVAAAAMGVPTVRMKLLAFAIGASTAGAAGMLAAARVNYVSPDTFTLLNSILVLAAVVLGGMGSILGSILGATAMIVIPEYIRSRSPGFQDYRFLIFGAILVVMMIFRPQGLLPSRRRAIELRGEVRDESLFAVRAAEAVGGRASDAAP